MSFRHSPVQVASAHGEASETDFFDIDLENGFHSEPETCTGNSAGEGGEVPSDAGVAAPRPTLLPTSRPDDEDWIDDLADVFDVVDAPAQQPLSVTDNGHREWARIGTHGCEPEARGRTQAFAAAARPTPIQGASARPTPIQSACSDDEGFDVVDAHDETALVQGSCSDGDDWDAEFEELSDVASDSGGQPVSLESDGQPLQANHEGDGFANSSQSESDDWTRDACVGPHRGEHALVPAAAVNQDESAHDCAELCKGNSERPEKRFGRGRHGDKMERLALSRHMLAEKYRKKMGQRPVDEQREIKQFADAALHQAGVRTQASLQVRHLKNYRAVKASAKDSAICRAGKLVLTFRDSGSRTQVPIEKCLRVAYEDKMTLQSMARMHDMHKKTALRCMVTVAVAYLYWQLLMLEAFAWFGVW